MRKIFMLAIANVRKRKSQATSLILFVLLAAMFLNIGLVLLVDYGQAFDERSEELNTAHLIIVQAEQGATDSQFQWISSRSNQAERQKVIAGQGEYWINDSKTLGYVIIANFDEPQSMNPATTIGEARPLTAGSIYVPYALKMAGYALGDRWTFQLSGSEIHYQIAGFTEELMFGTQMNSALRFYVVGADMVRLTEDFPHYRGVLTQVRLDNHGDASKLSQAFITQFPSSEDESMGAGVILSMTYDSARDARNFLPSLVAVLVTGFAIILLAVNLLVMRFGIVNNIEESTVNIGVQKAVGFRNRQIVASILMQFAGLAACGAILGIIASVLVMPVFASLLETQSAIVWVPGINWGFVGITLAFMVAAVGLVAYLSARRTYRLHPLVALRGGVETHSFKKNHIPLEHSRGTLSFLLGMKRLLGSPGQAITISIIVAAVSFACVAGVAIYYNVGVENDEFMSIIGGETPDISLILKDGNDFDPLKDRLLAHEDVRKVYGYQGLDLAIGDMTAWGDVAEDYSLFEGNSIVEGRYPRHSNEVAIGNAIMRVHGVNIGDSLTLTQGNRSQDYIVTGLFQAFRNNGNNVLLTYEGALAIQPDFTFVEMNIYLNPGIDASTFLKDLQVREGEILDSSIDLQEMFEANVGQIGPLFGLVALGIFVVTMVIVAMALYLVIKTTILRQRRDLGIQKAVGFTTWQITNQIALTLMPVISLAVVIGAIGAMVGLNPLFVGLTSSFGIVRTQFLVPPAWAGGTSILLIVMAYLVSILVALRTRKITAYSLVTE